MRLGMWNMREAVAAADNASASAMVTQLLGDLPLDVLALQEVPFDKDRRSAEIDAIAARSQLRYWSAFPLSSSVFDRESLSGLAVLSKKPQRIASRFCFPNPRLHAESTRGQLTTWDKGMLVVQLAGVPAPLHIASIHGFPFHIFGRDAADLEFDGIWKSLAAELDQVPGTVVVAGDFNTERLELVTSRLTKHNMQHLVKGAGGTLDEILCDSNVTMNSMTITNTFSDHPLFVAELSFMPDMSWT
jgi:endonuclease/exonuclease/phosphatase family metal-dependent hydrolase